MEQKKNRRVKVWDPLVRIGHWTIVVAFFVAYFTEEDLLSLHVWAGYVAGAAVALRAAWGFVGSRRARFKDFIYTPRAVLIYLSDLVRFRGKRYLGHSPAGGAMAVALLVMLAGTVITGLMTYGADRHAGPLASLYATGKNGAAIAMGEDRKEGALEDLHELFANLTLVLVLLHVAGVVWSSIVYRENLVAAMITGYKAADPHQPDNGDGA